MNRLPRTEPHLQTSTPENPARSMSKKRSERRQAIKSKEPFRGLEPNQIAAVFHVAAGSSNQEAADAVGVDRVTLWRWRQKETFQTATNIVQLEALEALQRGLIARVPRALSAVDGVLSSENEAARLRAALAILDRARDTEIGFTEVGSMIRADAERVHPDAFQFLLETLRRIGPFEPENDSPEAEQRQRYLEERLKELGLDSEWSD